MSLTHNHCTYSMCVKLSLSLSFNSFEGTLLIVELSQDHHIPIKTNFHWSAVWISSTKQSGLQLLVLLFLYMALIVVTWHPIFLFYLVACISKYFIDPIVCVVPSQNLHILQIHFKSCASSVSVYPCVRFSLVCLLARDAARHTNNKY